MSSANESRLVRDDGAFFEALRTNIAGIQAQQGDPARWADIEVPDGFLEQSTEPALRSLLFGAHSRLLLAREACWTATKQFGPNAPATRFLSGVEMQLYAANNATWTDAMTRGVSDTFGMVRAWAALDAQRLAYPQATGKDTVELQLRVQESVAGLYADMLSEPQRAVLNSRQPLSLLQMWDVVQTVSARLMVAGRDQGSGEELGDPAPMPPGLARLLIEECRLMDSGHWHQAQNSAASDDAFSVATKPFFALLRLTAALPWRHVDDQAEALSADLVRDLAGTCSTLSRTLRPLLGRSAAQPVEIALLTTIGDAARQVAEHMGRAETLSVGVADAAQRSGRASLTPRKPQSARATAHPSRN